MADARTLYDEDFVAWTMEQAEALRSAGAGGSNQQLDWENLAEEIESLGKSDRRALRGALRDLGERGEVDRAAREASRGTRYTIDEVLSDWFPPEPAP
jgi:hypothetical protein